MLKKSFIASVIAFICAATAFAQTAKTPAKNSSERTAILNAARVPVEKELKQKVQFSIQTIKTQGVWAFINGEPQNASGGEPNYKNTPYQEAIDGGAFDNNFQVLLKKTGGKWKVVTYAIGCTDVCWLGWDKKFKAPSAIFPGSE